MSYRTMKGNRTLSKWEKERINNFEVCPITGKSYLELHETSNPYTGIDVYFPSHERSVYIAVKSFDILTVPEIARLVHKRLKKAHGISLKFKEVQNTVISLKEELKDILESRVEV